jgi:hypothetical protein
VSIRLLNCQTRNFSRSCISRSTSQSHSLSDSISQRASLFTYHLVRTGYSPGPSSRITHTTQKTLVSLPTDCASSGLGSAHRTVTYAELATDPTQLTSSRPCHRHVTICLRVPNGAFDVYSWDILLWYTVNGVMFEWALLCPKLSGCLLQRHGGFWS